MHYKDFGKQDNTPGGQVKADEETTSQVEDRFLRLQALCDRALSAPVPVQRLNNVHRTTVFIYTVRKRLNEYELKSRIPVTGPLLTADEDFSNVFGNNFAREHLNWNADDWSAELFMDKSRFNRYSSDGRPRI
ncbi:uncharacterized protein [Diabrotica undecimpunctata]|uniref:uncharacterized protein n=1 Tax=Diabrotica undecimpunctata TaxID=50387 RepID=UPI003B64266D